MTTLDEYRTSTLLEGFGRWSDGFSRVSVGDSLPPRTPSQSCVELEQRYELPRVRIRKILRLWLPWCYSQRYIPSWSTSHKAIDLIDEARKPTADRD